MVRRSASRIQRAGRITERPYRGLYRRTGTNALVAIDFYAESRGLALDHADTLARDLQGTVVRVTRIQLADVIDAGAFRSITDKEIR